MGVRPSRNNGLKALLRTAFRLLGKGDRKVAAVFGFSPEACHNAVQYLRRGAPGVPVWLFSTARPLPETIALCERVVVRRSPVALFFEAQRELWRHALAISAGDWTGGPGNRVLKLAPLLIPPFRAVFANDHGDFLSGSPSNILRHAQHRLRDAVSSAVCSLRRAAWAVWCHIALAVCRVRQDAWTAWCRVALAVCRLRQDAWTAWCCIRLAACRVRQAVWTAWCRVALAVCRLRQDAWTAWCRIRLAACRVRQAAWAVWCRIRLDVCRVRQATWWLWCRVRSAGCRVAPARVASILLGWCGYPDRRLFHLLHGSGFLQVPHVPAGGSGVAWFVCAGPNWDGLALERFALESRARWIAWSRHGGVPVSDMLPLFFDECTFATSRQEHHRQWRLPLFATAAFRPLQPGEASQVLAPLSGMIVVDRAKLLALGIPKCKLAFAAWLLLFWKAGAAGWRSYSVGCPEQVGQQPDYPLEERAFLYNVLTDRALRRLGPGEPHHSRGNVAFTPGTSLGRRGDSGRPRVLVVSPFLPYPLSHGGAVRMFNLCRALSHRVDFALVAIHESLETVHYDKLREVFQEVRVVDMDEPVSRDARLPAQVRQHQSRSLHETIARLAESWQPDLLQVEFTHMAEFRGAAPHTPAILVEHDLTFSLYGQIADSDGSEASRREYLRWLEFERRWLRAYDAVWTVSEEDRLAAIREGSSADFTYSVPNGVDIFRFLPGDEPTPNPEILFVGSFRHLPNVLSFEKLRTEIMPRVWREFPNAVARVVAGPDHEWFWRKLAPKGTPLYSDPRIEVHGFVEDLRPLYARAAAVVAPLDVSAGTNIKVLEAMACGKAIVTTPAGCGGLGLRDGHDALIRAGWPAFAAALCDVLAGVPQHARLGREARLATERRFSWAAIQEEAYRSYLELHERHTVRAAAGD